MLSNILRENRRYSAEYGPRLSNHLSMAVLALDRMGADDVEIRKFSQSYRSHHDLHLLDASSDWIDAATWRDRLGDVTAEAAAIRYFNAAIKHSGRHSVLATHVPLLIKGVGAGAFHPLIRTAYAIEADDNAEIASALGYWTASYLDLGEPHAGSGHPASIDDTLYQYGALVRPDILPLADGPIHHRMESAAAAPYFQDFADLPVADDGNQSAFAALALSIFSRTLDFVALHMMTGTHAFRLLQPWVGDRGKSNAYFWRALLAVYAAMGAPDIANIRDKTQSETPSWEELFRIARRSSDDHVIKSIYTAWREQQIYGGDLYPVVARNYANKVALRPL